MKTTIRHRPLKKFTFERLARSVVGPYTISTVHVPSHPRGEHYMTHIRIGEDLDNDYLRYFGSEARAQVVHERLVNWARKQAASPQPRAPRHLYNDRPERRLF